MNVVVAVHSVERRSGTVISVVVSTFCRKKWSPRRDDALAQGLPAGSLDPNRVVCRAVPPAPCAVFIAFYAEGGRGRRWQIGPQIAGEFSQGARYSTEWSVKFEFQIKNFFFFLV